MKKVEFFRETYSRVTSEPYGHLLVDLGPKTSDCLRFSFNITSSPIVFHLPSELAEVISISNEREKRGYTEALAKQKNQERVQKVHLPL